VLAVVVLYNRPFDAVPCAALLRQWLAAPAPVCTRMHLAHCLIYDNSPLAPQPALPGTQDERFDTYHDAANGGTRAAYLHALELAKVRGYGWILLLDHDTGLPVDFFQDAGKALAGVSGWTGRICAIVPRVYEGRAQISPARITAYGRVVALQCKNPEASSGGLTAIASACIIRADSLAAVVPIPAAFSLDYLDHWLFREMQRRGERIGLSSALIEHSLSVQSMRSIGIDRYRSILAAEVAFLRGFPNYSRILHFLWHIGRLGRLAIAVRRPALVGVWARAVPAIFRTP